MSSDSAVATAYPETELYEQWKDHADELGMPVSEYIQAMVTAGRKKFENEVQPDQNAAELRLQRNDMKRELETARSRISRLEEELHGTEREEIVRHIQKHPGATFDEIVQHIIDTASGRVSDQLEMLEGDEIARDGDQFYSEESS